MVKDRDPVKFGAFCYTCLVLGFRGVGEAMMNLELVVIKLRQPFFQCPS